MSKPLTRSRFGRRAFLAIAYGAAVMIVLSGFDNLHPVLRASLPFRAAAVAALGVAVHARWLRQDRGEVALFWTGMALIVLRLVFTGDVALARVALIAIATGSLMMPLALLVAPPNRRTRWTLLTLCLCLAASAVPIIPVMPAGFVALAAYMALLWAVLMVLDQHARTADEAWTMALSDQLTDLPNRRAIQVELDHAVSRGDSTALLIVDLDRFKALNDVEGHAAGDDALRHVATALKGVVAGRSLVGRWGGEEFVLVLHDDQAADPGLVAEQARAAVAESTPVTASIGIALLVGDDDVFTWMRRADKALYRAKDNGRDRVEFEPAAA